MGGRAMEDGMGQCHGYVGISGHVYPMAGIGACCFLSISFYCFSIPHLLFCCAPWLSQHSYDKNFDINSLLGATRGYQARKAIINTTMGTSLALGSTLSLFVLSTLSSSSSTWVVDLKISPLQLICGISSKWHAETISGGPTLRFLLFFLISLVFLTGSFGNFSSQCVFEGLCDIVLP